jgi:FkbM family methyltransferase
MKRIFRPVQQAMKSLIKLNPKLYFAYAEQRRNRNLFRKPVQTPLGFWFCGNKGMESGTFEKDEVEKIRVMLESADLFVNVGANIGYYACIAASMKKNVIAFEPDAANCRLLYKNIHLNGYEQLVEVFPLALAERPGILEIFGLGTGASIVNIWDNKEQGILIPVNTLDQVIGHRVKEMRCLYLVDVEGAEHLVLKGGLNCLADEKSVWIVEITSPEKKGNELAGDDRFRGVFRVFSEKGFSPYLLSDGGLVMQEEIDQADSGVKNRLSNQNMFVFR